MTGSKGAQPRKNLTYAKKLEICKLTDSGDTKSGVVKKFGLNESTVRSIYVKKEHILKHMSLPLSAARSSAKISVDQVLLKTKQLFSRYFEVSKAKYKWKQPRKYIVIRPRNLMWKPHQCSSLQEWVDRFMTRHNVKNVTVSGEAASGDRQPTCVYPESLEKKLLRLASLPLIKALVTLLSLAVFYVVYLLFNTITPPPFFIFVSLPYIVWSLPNWHILRIIKFCFF